MRLTPLGLCVLAACGGGTKSTATPTRAAPTCVVVADRMIEQMLTDKAPRPDEATVTSIKDIISTRCEQDGWTAAAKDCLAKMKNEADADRCAPLLTEEQQAALVRDERARSGEPTDDAEADEEHPAAAPPASEAARTGSSPNAPPPPSKTRGPAKTSDPCDGGE